MRILIQRVTHASVSVDGTVIGEIGAGLLVFVAIRETDTIECVRWMAEKVAQVRIFDDLDGKMNLSVEDIGGSILAVSQFTLYGALPKGNRPSFMAAASPEKAESLYNEFLKLLRDRMGADRIASGKFRAKMSVELTNDGPVTILLEKENGFG
jgi:D-tyrosyl-tRNA(Tyr) deacylase